MSSGPGVVRIVAASAAIAGLLLACGGATPALAQSRHDPDAPRVEQAALALVQWLDEGRYDEVAAKLNADAARYDPSGALRASGTRGPVLGLVGGLPSEAALRQALETRRARGKLSNRQTIQVFVAPLQSQIATGRDPAKQVRGVRVEFDTDPETPMFDRRRNAARVYREAVSGYLMPGGELLLVSYDGSAQHASDRVARPDAAAANATTAAVGTGTTAPEAVAIERALEIATLLDQGRNKDVLAKIRAGMPEHYGTDAQWAPVSQRLVADFMRRMQRGGLSGRKVMIVGDGGGQGTYAVTLGATGARAPVPQRYGPNPMASSETVRVQVFGGEVRVLDYRFAY